MSLFRSYARDQFNGLLWGKGVHGDDFCCRAARRTLERMLAAIYSNEREKEEYGTAKTTRHEKKFSDSFCFSFADPLSFRPLSILSESSTFGGA